MDVSYSLSNIAGFKSHLPVQKITLPLKYPSQNQEQNTNERFHALLAETGAIIDLSASQSYIDFVSWDLLADLKTITLSPINSSVKKLELPLQNIQVTLPHKIVSSKSVSITYQSDQSGNEDGYIIVDLVDENFLFVTLRFALSDFIVANNSSKFSLGNFDQWGHISVPYSFEMRSDPYLVKTVDPLKVIVSLKDGGFLIFKRSAILEDVEVGTFSEASSILPFTFLSGIFKKDPRQEVVLEGISSNTIVDVIQIDSNTIASLTVRKVLKLWSTDNLVPTSTPIELTEINDSSSWLTSVPAKYFQVISSKTGQSYLSLYYSTNSADNSKSRYVFKTWKIRKSDTIVELELLDHLTFQPELPNILLLSSSAQPSFQNTLWFIQDYQTQLSDDSIKFHILWKSNTSSVLVTLAINFQTGAIESKKWSHSQEGKTFEELGPYHDSEYYRNKILNSGRYNDLILQTSLDVFRSYKGLDSVDKKSFIRDSTEETIKLASNNDPYETKQNWYKLETLCAEFKKLGEEDLAISLTNQATLLTIQANGLGIFRPSHYFESFPYKKLDTPEGKLFNILNKLNNVLSTKTYHRILARIRSTTSLTLQDSNEWYEDFIGNKLSDEEAQNIVNELGNIEDAFGLLDTLIGSVDYVSIDDLGADKLTDSLDIPPAEKLNTVLTFKNIIASHESIVLNLFVLFLVCDSNDRILLLLNKIINKLNIYDIVRCIFDTSFKKQNKTSRIENENLNILENSLFWSGIVDNNPQLNYLIRGSRMNEACDYFIGTVLSSYKNFIVDVTLDLLNRDEGKFIKSTFFKMLNRSRNIDRFIIGLVYLINSDANEFFETFETYELFDIARENELKEKIYKSLANNETIKIFLDIVFSEDKNPVLKKADYFHALAELSKEQAARARRHSHSQKFITPTLTTTSKSVSPVETNFIKTALSFELRAIEILKEIESPDEVVLSRVDSYYLNVFDFALNTSNYDAIYDALSNLSPNSSLYEYTDLFNRFINKLIANQSIYIIFPPHPNALYKKYFLLIDNILLNIANHELALSSSLKLYEYLYSWRLFGASNSLTSKDMADRRGAVESLYMFITRFKDERKNLIAYSATPTIEDVKQYKLKILELYMIILNCLKGFDNEEDQWIVKQKDAESLSIVKLEELKIEYFEWFRELEDDLRNEI
ncbi:hypothetical protein G9P44_001986 [Scheffersomyces stipitis]|nr:hypothetical protein G9P44_001986 [Scheffersomyces stipitis]